MEQSEKPLHVVELRSENIKRIQAVTVRPNGNTVIIGGKNGAGKSSLIDSLEYALGGTKTLPADPVRRGARKGRVVLDLGEIVVERTFSSKGTQLVVKNAAGEPQKSPQTLLDKLCSKVAFDPFAFTRETPAKQDAILRDVMGIDFSELDAKRSKAYEQRRETNREAKRLRAQLDGMSPHNDAPEEEVSVAELSKDLQQVWSKTSENDSQRRELEVAENHLGGLRDDIQGHRANIADLEEQLAQARSELEYAEEVAAKFYVEVEELRESIDQLIDPDPEPIRQQIATAEETNRKVRENTERLRLEQDLARLDAQAEQLTEAIAEVDAEKAAQLEAAEFPVPGLGFDDTGPTLNGFPLEQCSQAERLRLSVAIGAALNPRVKVMLVRDGSLLDSDSMRLLAELAEETGSQVWVERVGDGDESAVVIEDGMVREAEEGAAE